MRVKPKNISRLDWWPELPVITAIWSDIFIFSKTLLSDEKHGKHENHLYPEWCVKSDSEVRFRFLATKNEKIDIFFQCLLFLLLKYDCFQASLVTCQIGNYFKRTQQAFSYLMQKTVWRYDIVDISNLCTKAVAHKVVLRFGYSKKSYLMITLNSTCKMWRLLLFNKKFFTCLFSIRWFFCFKVRQIQTRTFLRGDWSPRLWVTWHMIREKLYFPREPRKWTSEEQKISVCSRTILTSGEKTQTGQGRLHNYMTPSILMLNFFIQNFFNTKTQPNFFKPEFFKY